MIRSETRVMKPWEFSDSLYRCFVCKTEEFSEQDMGELYKIQSVDLTDHSSEEQISLKIGCDISFFNELHEAGHNQGRPALLNEGGKNKLLMNVSLICDQTRFAKTLMSKKITSSAETEDVEIFKDIKIERKMLGDKARIRFSLLLADSRNSAPPNKPFSLISEKEVNLRFEIGGRNFPTEWISFKDRALPDTLCYLHIKCIGDFSTLKSESAILYLNKDIGKFQEIMSDNFRSNVKAQQVLRGAMTKHIEVSVYNSILQAALNHEAEEDIQIGEEDSFWDVIFKVMLKVFPEEWDKNDPEGSFKSLSERYRSDPSMVYARCEQAISLSDIF